MALAGGVNIILSPKTTMTLSRAKMMAADGRCKAFDARADGFVRGEGCGLVVLKRLSDAVADGDRVLALIRGSAVNQDGRSNGLTAPNGPSQVAVIRAAIADAGVEPGEVSYVETHGTGTALGDPIEAQALGAALGAGRSAGNRLMIGSAKTNLGHLESAAGIAGLLKVVLALQHGEIPPLLHLTEPNPYIPWDELPHRHPDQLVPRGRRRAASGSPGSARSGSAAPTLTSCSRGPVRSRRGRGAAPSGRCTCSSCRRAPSRHSAQLRRALRRRTSRRTRRRRSPIPRTPPAPAAVDHTHRLAVVAADTGDAGAALAAFVAGETVARRRRQASPGQRAPEVAFLFTGHGAQYVDMGRTLYATQPVFREAIDRCADLLAPLLPHPLSERAVRRWARRTAERRLDGMDYAQPALFAVEYALATLWQSWGVRPSVVTGHSVGEYVAAVVAGRDQPRRRPGVGRGPRPADGLAAARRRDGDGVRHRGTRHQRASPRHGGRVSIAAINGPESIALSGTGGALQVVLDELRGEGVKVRPLAIPVAAHSPQVDPILDEFERAAATVRYSAPRAGCGLGHDRAHGRRRRPDQRAATGDSTCASRCASPTRFADDLRRRETDLRRDRPAPDAAQHGPPRRARTRVRVVARRCAPVTTSGGRC